MEEFKIAFEDYEISNFGNCRRNGKEIKGSIQNRGYKYIQLQRDSKRINLLFHHLVAKCFIGERPNDLVIDHIDRNKLNNNVENLRYITQKENMKNQDRYRDDIKEENLVLRKRILQKESAIRTGKIKGTNRVRGTGSLQQRKENNKFRAIIKINKIKYDKTFDTKEEANNYLNEIITSTNGN
jgi:hypothetical protein